MPFKQLPIPTSTVVLPRQLRQILAGHIPARMGVSLLWLSALLHEFPATPLPLHGSA